MRIAYTDRAFRQLDALDPPTRERIMEKMQWLTQQDEPLRFAHPLRGSVRREIRFRIGDWRVIVHPHGDQLLVLRIGNRRDIYR